MFEEFQGIPAHPLLVHAAVVFVPLLALLAAGYAVVPAIRAHTRWVLGLLALAAPASALLAKLSGDAFFDRLDTRGQITAGFYPTIEAHQQWGNRTLYAAAALAVVALALVVLVGPRPAAAAHASAPTRGGRALPLVLAVLVVLAAAASLYCVVQAGDSGAKAVWEGR